MTRQEVLNRLFLLGLHMQEVRRLPPKDGGKIIYRAVEGTNIYIYVQATELHIMYWDLGADNDLSIDITKVQEEFYPFNKAEEFFTLLERLLDANDKTGIH